MIVFALFYGYEDLEGIFSSEAKSLEYKDVLIKAQPYRRPDNFTILEEVVDAPNK